MKIAVFEGVRKVRITEIPKPVINDYQVLIKVESCAICTWEQRVYTGVKSVPFPFVGGHEIAGKIVEIGQNVDMRNVKIGDKVVHGTLLSCGLCKQCRTGNDQNCVYFDHTQPLAGTPYIGMGGFSEYMVAKPENLYRINAVESAEAALIEPISCCIHSIETSSPQFGDRVLVVGCGIMGLIHVQLAKHKGCVVIAADFDENRLLNARELGAHYTINNRIHNLQAYIDQISNGHGVDIIFNTTPMHAVASEMELLLSIQGKQVLYSSFYPDNPMHLSPDTLHKKAQQLQGTANSNSCDFIRAITMLEHQILDVKPFISQRFNFDDIEAAMDASIQGGHYRIVIDF